METQASMIASDKDNIVALKFKGFDVKSGHVGILPNGSHMLFPTQDEYIEYMRELQEGA